MTNTLNQKNGFGKKFLIAFSLLILLFISIYALRLYRQVFSPNLILKTGQDNYIYIPTGSDFSGVIKAFQEKNLLLDYSSFQKVAERMGFPDKIKPGRYKLKHGMNNREIVSLLRSGMQSPVRVTFNNSRTIFELCGQVASQIEADSASLAYLLTNPDFLKNNNLTAENCLVVFIPNTYEFYWNTNPEQFFDRMIKEYNRFWSEGNKAKAKEIGFSPVEVSVLASIVEKESNKIDERPVIAGVYINRFKKGWKLEADPTLVFALGDFTVRRVLNEYKEIDSPYNTYLHEGLPPGPICMPSTSSIAAVLNYSRHTYMFFCARDDFSGYHTFATDYASHLVNAKRFQKELSRRNIRS